MVKGPQAHRCTSSSASAISLFPCSLGRNVLVENGVGSHDSDWWLCATGGARADRTLLRINPVILSCCFHFTLPDWLKLVALSESLAIQFGDAGRPELDARHRFRVIFH